MDMAGATWMREETEAAREEESTGEGVVLETSTSQTLLDEETSRSILLHSIEDFKSIKGYQAVAILDADGDIMAADILDGQVDLERLAVGISSIFSVSEETTGQIGFDRCRALTLHTSSGIILLVTSDLEAAVGLRLMGVTKPDGNWFYMKVQLENLFPKLLAGLS